MPNYDDSEIFLNLSTILKETVEKDQQLRKKYQVEQKFCFISQRLEELLVDLNQKVAMVENSNNHNNVFLLHDDELLVYVHLYNAQEGSIDVWKPFFTPQSLIEYSVNRPIYRECREVKKFINSKANVAQHGYLVVAIKKDDILDNVGENGPMQDSVGQPILKIKSGSLDYAKVHSFVHNEQEYLLTKSFELVSKSKD